MSVLRVYLPSECDSAGVPLDWERCRGCGGDGKNPERDGSYGAACRICAGHGSLKAAALAERLMRFRSSVPIPKDEIGHRCEDCGHPMSEGTWNADPCFDDGVVPDYFWRNVAAGGFTYPTFVHHSRCDKGCRHGGPGRARGVADRPGTTPTEDGPRSFDLGRIGYEASWRPVDVRCLSWPHDLRPEKLAVLCLRCWASRDNPGAPA